MNKLDISNIKNATRIQSQTLIGASNKQFPVEHGNCFSFMLEDDSEIQILNFNVENIRYLVTNHGITYPIKVLPHPDNEHIGYVCDERIPDRWYRKDICEVCCPNHLLPHNQRLVHLRDIMLGRREERDNIIKTSYFKEKPDF